MPIGLCTQLRHRLCDFNRRRLFGFEETFFFAQKCALELVFNWYTTIWSESIFFRFNYMDATEYGALGVKYTHRHIALLAHLITFFRLVFYFLHVCYAGANGKHSSQYYPAELHEHIHMHPPNDMLTWCVHVRIRIHLSLKFMHKKIGASIQSAFPRNFRATQSKLLCGEPT